MSEYRLYVLGGKGKIERAAEWIEAKTDQEAIVLARAKKLAMPSELWDGNRLVAKVPADH